MSTKLQNSNKKTNSKAFQRKYHWGTNKQNNHVKINGQLIQLWFGGVSKIIPLTKIKEAISRLRAVPKKRENRSNSLAQRYLIGNFNTERQKS